MPSEASAGGDPLRPRASIGVPMRNQPAAVPVQREAGPVSPVIAGGAWLGDDDLNQSLTLQLSGPRRKFFGGCQAACGRAG